MATTDDTGQGRAKSVANDTQPQGRSGSGSMEKPSVVGAVRHNPEKSGGINRATGSGSMG